MENLKSITRRTITTLSDPALYNLCKEYGKRSRKWAREFGFLLPEVARRNLHRKYGCASIQMFAAKLAGMNHEVVDRILSLHKKLIAKPLLWTEFPRFGWSKLRVVAEVCEFESEEFWVDKLRRCPKIVLEEYVRKYREFKLQLGKLSNITTGRKSVNSNTQARTPALDTTHVTSVPLEDGQTSLFSSNKTESPGALDLGDEKNVSQNLGYMATANEKLDFISIKAQSIQIPDPNYFKKLKFNVDAETEFLFREFKQNLEKQQKQAITMEETLRRLIEKVKGLDNKNRNLEQKVKKVRKNNLTKSQKSHLLKSTKKEQEKPEITNTIEMASIQARARDAQGRNGFVTDKTSTPPLQISATSDKSPYSPYQSIAAKSHTTPQKIKNSLHKTYGSKCAFPSCNKPATDFHHVNRFSLTREHKNIYPLCKLHHQAIHSGLIKNEDQPIENWRMDFEPEKNLDTRQSELTRIFSFYQNMEKEKVDAKVRNHWQ